MNSKTWTRWKVEDEGGEPFYRDDYWPRSKAEAIKDANRAHEDHPTGKHYVVVEHRIRGIYTTHQTREDG